MNTIIKNILILVFISSLFGSCAGSFHKEMSQDLKKELGKKEFTTYTKSYSESLVDVAVKKQTYISISADKSLKDTLSELENIDNNIYFLETNDILIPKSRIKIRSINDLKNYIEIVLNKKLLIEKIKRITKIKLLNPSESKKNFFEKLVFKLEGEISVEELSKLITAKSSFEFSFGKYIKNIEAFNNSIISIKCKTLKEAINALGSSKNIYIDINYDKELISIRRYKDIVVELNIPLLDLETSNKMISTAESTESEVKNNSKITLYNELNSILKSIVSKDTIASYHIDRGTGLIFLRGNKEMEKALRTIVKAYETSYLKETTITFERIEIILNKDRKYGLAGINSKTSPSSKTSLETAGTADLDLLVGGKFSLTRQGTNKLLELTGVANNTIGRILNYSKNLIVLKNNIPTVQTISRNTDYIEKIETTISENSVTSEATVNTIKDGTSITAMAKISRDKIFLNITPNIRKLIKISEAKIGNSVIQLPEYKYQSYNISREVRLGETVIVGSIIVHDDAKEYEGVIPIEHFILGGTDAKSYIRREIVYVVTVKSIKGF